MQPKVRVKHLCFRLAYHAAKVYWRILKPKTYGVKVVLTQGSGPEAKVLLVQHSYGAKNSWNLPGGGYKPEKEAPEAAARRELREELGFPVAALVEIGSYHTQAQGKRDTVTIYQSVVSWGEPDIAPASPEIESVRWVTIRDIREKTLCTARIVREAVRMLLEAEEPVEQGARLAE